MNHNLLFTRIDNMLAKVPAEEADFWQKLEKIKESAGYTAPEAIGDRYYQVLYLLESKFGEKGPILDWENEVVNEWLKQTPLEAA